MDYPDVLIDCQTERFLLQSIMIDNDLLFEFESYLVKNDFHDERNQKIFESMDDIHRRGDRVDLWSVEKNLGTLSKEGHIYLRQIVSENVPSLVYAKRYGERVHRLATLRRLMDFAAKTAMVAAHSANDDLTDVLENIRRQLDSLSPQTEDRDYILFWKESLEQHLISLVERENELREIEQGLARPLLRFPWNALEKYIFRIREGTISMVVAEEKVGKTTFMECCAEHWAQQGYQVAFFHLELSHQIMTDRRIVRRARVPMEAVERGTITESMARATDDMKTWTGAIHYVHCPRWSAERIANEARLLQSEGRCDIAIVDYLQKVRLDYGRSLNQAALIGDCVEVFKSNAEMLEIPYIVGSQMNRRAKETTRKTADLVRGSGEAAEKCNIALTLDRPILDSVELIGSKTYNPGDRSPHLKIRVDLNTLGPTGETTLLMQPEFFTITNLTFVQDEPPPDLQF